MRSVERCERSVRVRFLAVTVVIRVLFVLGAEQGMSGLSEGVVVARQEIDYRHPLAYRPDGVDVTMWVSELTTGKFVLGYEVHDEATVFAEARTVMVPFDLATGRSRRVSESEHAYLSRFLPAPAA